MNWSLILGPVILDPRFIFFQDVWTSCWRAPEDKHNDRAMITLYQLKTNANARLNNMAASNTIVKQICFPYGNVLFLSLFSLSKNWMHYVGWGCAEILPEMKLFTFRCVNTEASADCNDYSKTSLNSFFSFWSSSKVIEVSKKRKHHLRSKHQIVYIPPRNHLSEGWLQWTNCEAY